MRCDARMFWERVKDLLEKDKLTITALADVTGVSRATMYNWTGRNIMPPADKAIMIALVLKADPVKLVLGDHAPDPESLRLSAGVASSVEAKGKRMAMEEVQRLAKELEDLKRKLVSEQA